MCVCVCVRLRRGAACGAKKFEKEILIGGKCFPENVFQKTFLVTKMVAVGAFGAFPLRIAVIFQADADFEVKSAVDSYF